MCIVVDCVLCDQVEYGIGCVVDDIGKLFVGCVVELVNEFVGVVFQFGNDLFVVMVGCVLVWLCVVDYVDVYVVFGQVKCG